MKQKLITLVSLLVLLSSLLAACGAEQATPEPAPALDADAVVAEGHIQPLQDITLYFAVSGRVDEVLVEEGETVKKDAVLIRLGDREQAEAALATANQELVVAQQEFDDFMRNTDSNRAGAWEKYMQAQVTRGEAEKDWEDLNVDDIEDRIEDAKADVSDAKEDLDDAQEDYDKYKDLAEDNTDRENAKDDLERAQEDYNQAVRDLEELVRDRDDVRAKLDAAIAAEAEAKRKYELTKDGPDAEVLALREARLNNAKAHVASAQNSLDSYDLKAPFDGVVTDVDVTPGERIGPEKWVVKMADFSAWTIETSDLTELEVVKVYEGQRVEIVPDALPDLTLDGSVESVAQSFTSQSGDILYKVKIRLDDEDKRLRWGMTVEVTFIVE